MKVRKLKEETVRRKISVVEKTILSSPAGYKGELPHSEAVQHWNRLLRGGCAVSVSGGFQDETESSPEQPGLT